MTARELYEPNPVIVGDVSKKLPHLHLGLWASKHFLRKVVQSPSYVQLFSTPWTVARQASLPLTISQSLHKFMSMNFEVKFTPQMPKSANALS